MVAAVAPLILLMPLQPTWALCFNGVMWPFQRRKTRIYTPPPRSAPAPAAVAALRKVPGPSPWYLNGTEVSTRTGLIRWRSAGDESPFAGKSLLVDTNEQVLALTDFNCYVRPLGEDRLLVQYAEEEGEGPLLRRDVRFRVFDTNALHPITDLEAAYARLSRKYRFHAAGGEITSVALSTALDDGVHTVELPEALHGVGEQFVLVGSTADGRRDNHFDQMHLRLWILDAPQRRLEIIPQDWFNRGPYDFMYQWVTRAARLADTGEVVGEGIRLGIFRLDASKRQIAEWLVEDIFYRPEEH